MPDDQADESLGTWLRRRRKALDLTQAALADCVGCAEVTIRKQEAEFQRPSRQLAERLATCLRLTPDERAVFLDVVRGQRRADRLVHLRPPGDLGGRAPAYLLGDVLPLDTVPPLAPLPPGSRMPLRRNPLFVGRDADLRQLARALTVSGTAAIGQVEIAAATGLGGIGKTQLACEFVHRYGQFFAGGVCWLSFGDPAAVPAEVAACGGVDGMQLSAAFDTLPLEQQVRQVRAAWKEPLPRLLVFDNCEEAALLEQWRPPHGGCCVLLTSRRQQWDATLGVQTVPLDVFPRAESTALLHAFRPDLAANDTDLAAIADILGDLPLALHLAGSFLAHYRHALTPAQYVARLHTPALLDDRSLQAAGISPTQHVQHVARTFEQSYDRLDAADPVDALARTLLAHAAYFAPGESLPRWLLLQTLELPEGTPAQALGTEDALTRLTDLGLLDTDATGNLRLHRLVVAFVQVVLGDATVQAAVEATILRVVDALNDQRNPRPVLAVQPHLRFLTEAALPRADARAAGLGNALGVHLWQLGIYAEAQRYHEQALAIRRRVLGDDHPDVARSLNNLGSVLWRQGQHVQAQRYHEQALAMYRRVLGDDHPGIILSLTSLGAVLESQGQYAQAQRYHEQALAMYRRVLGDDHPDMAHSLNNLGSVLNAQGQYAQAQCYHTQALAICEGVLEPDHPDIARSLINLGSVLKRQGQYAQAQHYHEQALAMYRRVLGDDHPHTAQSMSALGVALHARGQHTKAQRYHEQALAIRRRVLGGDHPHTARSMRVLGKVLHAQEETVRARNYLEQALAIFLERLGPRHPDTAESLYQLGLVLQTQGQEAEARRSIEQALTIYEQAVGVDHPSTQGVRASLAALLEQHRER